MKNIIVAFFVCISFLANAQEKIKILFQQQNKNTLDAPLLASDSGFTVIRAGKLFDSRGGTVNDKQIIIIQGNIITDVRNDDGKYPAGAKVIDLSTKFVMPGMMDAHVHFFLHPYNEASWDDQVTKETL